MLSSLLGYICSDDIMIKLFPAMAAYLQEYEGSKGHAKLQARVSSKS